VASALTTLGIAHERLSGERQTEFDTPLRITSEGIPDFLRCLKDSALNGKRSASAEKLVRYEAIFVKSGSLGQRR